MPRAHTTPSDVDAFSQRYRNRVHDSGDKLWQTLPHRRCPKERASISMPEGHTIHRLARDQRKRFLGHALEVSSPQGRFEEDAATLHGKHVEQIDAHGKHLFYRWSDDSLLHVHLGLFGRFRNHRCPPPEPRGTVRCRVVGPAHGFDLIGPTACELLSPAEEEAIRKRLGVDPLREDADADALWERIRRSRAAIGSLLLNQAVIAGVGNVYRAEALFAMRLHPERTGASLTRDQFDDLWEWLVEHMRIGVRYNRIITASVSDKPPSRLKRGERLLCYKKPRCGRCNSVIQSWELAQRKIYACPGCQS